MTKNNIIKIFALLLLALTVLSACNRPDFNTEDYYAWESEQAAKESLEQSKESETVPETDETTGEGEETTPEDTTGEETTAPPADTEAPVEDIEKTPSEASIPDYWISPLRKGAQEINQALCTAGSNKSAFLFYSDAHWTASSKVSPLLLKYLYQNTGINKTIFGGDIVQDESDSFEDMQYLWEWRSMIKDLPNHHSVVGAYDDGSKKNNRFSEQFVYGYLLAPEETPDIVRGNNGLYYYIDDNVEKTRYLYLDTAFVKVNDSQKEFVKNALISTPNNWHIIVVANEWYELNYNVTPYTIAGLTKDASVLVEMFDEYNKRVGDFSYSQGWVEFCVGGSTHTDYAGYSKNGIPIILVETDSSKVRGSYKYTKGTATEASVNGIVADYDKNVIHVIRVGRGEGQDVEIKSHNTSVYGNALRSSLSDDGQTIYNINGYKNLVRWSVSGQEEVLQDDSGLSGWIRVSKGDVIYLKDLNMNRNYANTAIYLSESIGTVTTKVDATALTSSYDAIWDENGVLQQFTVNKHCYYIRIQCNRYTDKSIVSINKPIE